MKFFSAKRSSFDKLCTLGALLIYVHQHLRSQKKKNRYSENLHALVEFVLVKFLCRVTNRSMFVFIIFFPPEKKFKIGCNF